MKALTFSLKSGQAALQHDRPLPVPKAGEVLIKVLRAGICSTDLEICRGYVPGYDGVLGHEFVGVVVAHGPLPAQDPGSSDGEASQTQAHQILDSGKPPVGSRVVGEINCNDTRYTCADAVFQRNHAPGRSVLGIINRDGTLAEYLTLPVENLHVVPDALTDAEAAFTEPLAAACRIVEQGLPRRPDTDRVAVIGDGKLGLLVAQVLVHHVTAAGGPRVTLIGRHEDKMALVQGDVDKVVSEGTGAAVAERLAGHFDLVVEASGSSGGIRTALALCRPMGTILLKSTVSTLPSPIESCCQAPAPGGSASASGQGTRSVQTDGPASATAHATAPSWAEITNDIVVNEKILTGSRCGPFDVALELMVRDAHVRQLLRSMVSAELPLERGEEALAVARTKGVLKVQLVMGP